WLLRLVRLDGQRVIRAQDQRGTSPFCCMFLLGQPRARGGVEHVDIGVAAAALVHRRDRGGVPLLVGDPQLEVVVLEQLNVDDGRGVMVHPGGLAVRCRGRRLCPGRGRGLCRGGGRGLCRGRGRRLCRGGGRGLGCG